MTYYFSKLTLTRAGIESRMRRMSATAYNIHKEIWGLFPNDAEADRNFIYSVMDDDRTVFMVSEKEPVSNDFWQIETKNYDPQINDGDVFRFRLLANPTVANSNTGKHQRHDVVMDLKRKMKESGKDCPMNDIIHKSVSEWMVRKASMNGFEVNGKDLMIHSYQRNESRKDGRLISFSSVVIEGELCVHDRTQFMNALFNGIGSAKGFGCGMMMIRRP